MNGANGEGAAHGGECGKGRLSRAELTDDGLEIVYRNPKGRKLKTVPVQLAGAPGLMSLIAVRKALRAHRTACAKYAQAWAEAGTNAPRALAEADPEWRRALEEVKVPLTEERGAEGLFARTYAGPYGLTLTQLLPEDAVPYRDVLMREDAWLPESLVATGLQDRNSIRRADCPSPNACWRPTRSSSASPWRSSAPWRTPTRTGIRLQEKHRPRPVRAVESAPALAVTLLDEMADFALGQSGEAEAAAWFGRARKTERNSGRKPDHTWLNSRHPPHAGSSS